MKRAHDLVHATCLACALLAYCLLPGLLGLLACWTPASAAAAENEPVLRDMAVLEGHHSGETIASVAAAGAERFRALPHGFAGGYSNSPHWLRFTLDAPAGEWWLDMLPPFLDDLRLYVPDPDRPGAFIERRAGDHLSFEQREVAYRGFVFKIRKDTAAPMVLYLRLQTTSTLQLVARIWAPDAFHSAMTLEYSLLLGLIGMLLVVLLISLNAWFWFRDGLSLWFVAYLASLMCVFACQGGFVAQYLLPQMPAVTDALVSINALAATTIGFSFYRRLLLIEPSQRLLFNIFRITGLWPLGGLLVLAAGYVSEVLFALVCQMIPMTLLACWLSVRLWRRRSPGGGMLFAANLISMLGILAWYLALLGFAPGQVVSLYGMQISSLGTVIAVYLAIGARIRAIDDARLLADAESHREREARRRQTEFFAMLSHELKTPLAMIDGSVQSLELLTPKEPDIDRRHERIRRAVGRIDDLMQKFLHRSHLESESPALQKRPLALDALLRETVAGFAPAPGRIALEPNESLTLQGDEALLKVMISNLIDNALKYSPPESVVSVSLRRAQDMALLEVRDTGPGIAPDLRPRLFDSYVRGDKLGDIPGAGLGLYLVRRIAHLHGGGAKLLDTVTEKFAAGAAFRVSLPLAQEEA